MPARVPSWDNVQDPGSGLEPGASSYLLEYCADNTMDKSMRADLLAIADGVNHDGLVATSRVNSRSA